MVPQKNDQVFAVSLSEIAFTLLFLLMLLLGFMVIKERQEKEAAQEKVKEIRALEDAPVLAATLDAARERLIQALRQNQISDPLKLAEVVASTGADVAERKRLQQQNEDLTKKLVALEDFRNQLQQAGQRPGETVMREQVEKALVMQREVESLARTAGVTNASEAIKNALSSKSEGERLRTQIAFYEKRDKQRGLDHLPCWMDAQSKPEFIFNVQTTAAGIVVTRGWPDHREADAQSTSGFSTMMAQGLGALTHAKFSAAAVPYLEYGKKQSPECRHFVYLSSTISDADRRDEARRLVNGFFYVLERKTVTP